VARANFEVFGAALFLDGRKAAWELSDYLWEFTIICIYATRPRYIPRLEKHNI